MKSKIVEKGKETDMVSPLVAKSTTSKLVVLFIGSTTGMVLVSGDEEFSVGEFDDDWAECTDTDEWEILDSVTIKFES